ncbi:MAG: tRNA threonylcarbamoyladenosine biosynthesis protein TsaE [Halanaerobiales bacterium]|nr:tRNA threonylcarbamoyladenosine biosynthesis protein TsaE [Halanaerobiales bacterium]
MDEDIFKYLSRSEEDTIRLGERIGELVEPGQLILLAGELGAGKTVLTQGIAGGLGVEDEVTSPTYKLINEYEGELPLFHMDLYRLEEEEELYELGFEDYLERDGIIVIEWPDLAYDLLPPDFIYIKINILGDESREILIESEGDQGIRLLERLEDYVSDGD